MTKLYLYITDPEVFEALGGLEDSASLYANIRNNLAELRGYILVGEVDVDIAIDIDNQVINNAIIGNLEKEKAELIVKQFEIEEKIKRRMCLEHKS